MPARTRSTHTRLRYTALVQEANRIKQEYKSMRAQVSGSSASAVCGCMCCAWCLQLVVSVGMFELTLFQQQSFHR